MNRAQNSSGIILNNAAVKTWLPNGAKTSFKTDALFVREQYTRNRSPCWHRDKQVAVIRHDHEPMQEKRMPVLCEIEDINSKARKDRALKNCGSRRRTLVVRSISRLCWIL